MTTTELTEKSVQYRRNILKYIVGSNAGHTGARLSCVDILNGPYNNVLNVSPETATLPTRVRLGRTARGWSRFRRPAF